VLGIKRMDHVCMAVWKVDEQLPLLKEMFGMKELGRWRNDEEGYAGVTLDVDGKVQWELMEPTSDDSFVARFLRERGPGLHHVTFEVEDVDKAAEALRERGIEPFRGVRDVDGWRETYMHPRDSGGVLFQFFQEIRPGGWSGVPPEEQGGTATPTGS
jgi:methylmalonyl-CoA/ethylmalonyl-CoA epimerase